jgi:hypothetical protein
MTVAHHGNARLAGSNAPHRETHMKRLALVLAAAATVAGTGCGSSTPRRCANSVTVDWSGGFLRADGATRDCAGAFVSAVDLFINDDPNTAVRVACSQGAAQAVDLPDGTNLFTVEGIDQRGGGTGRIAFRAEVNRPFACGDQHVLVTPSQGTLALDYSLPGNACVAGGSLIFSEVRDDIANQLAFQDTSGSSPVCAPSPAPAPTFILPAGNFTLLGVNEVTASTFAVVGADCTDRPFQITGATTTTVTPSLVDSSTACF